MAKVACAICKKEGHSEKMYYCGRCNLWVHFECAGGSVGLAGFFGNNPHCPNCRKTLKK